MKITGYNIDLEKAVKTVNDNNYKTIALQLPEGLKIHTSAFVGFLEKGTNANVFVIADPCFGACDIASYELKNSDIDFVIQIGHTKMPSLDKLPIPALFLNAESDLDVTKIVQKAIPSLTGEKIGLVTTAQHIHMLDKVVELLIENNLNPVVGKGDMRIDKKGQILGCNFSAATVISKDVDSFLFIGSGNFHPLGLLIRTNKPVVIADPYTNQIRSKELDELKDTVLRQRYGAIARSKDAKIFGILVSTKVGQNRLKTAYEIKKYLESANKKAYIIFLSYFSPEYLESYREIQCFVSTACPRIAIDDYMQYKTPIITPVELEIAMGKKSWETYQFDEILD